MAERILDMERLLAPIEGDDPCGESLKWDVIYDEIKAARQQKDKDPLVEKQDLEADWSLVYELTTEAIATRSKDLMLAAYLIESLLWMHGFQGLREGIELLNNLVTKYWDNLYPKIDEDGDLEPRAASLVWLTDPNTGCRLPNAIREIPLTPPGDEGVGYSWNYWDSRIAHPKGESEDSSDFAARQAEAQKIGQIFEATAAFAPIDFYKDLIHEIEPLKELFEVFATDIDEKLGDVAPGWTAFRKAIEDCEIVVRRQIKDKGGDDSQEAQEGVSGDSAAADGTDSNSASGTRGPIRSRADAIAQLEEAARSLRQIEPHSPVAFLVERAIRWSHMPFGDVLKDLVKDESVMKQI